jgi:hypothetical protein
MDNIQLEGFKLTKDEFFLKVKKSDTCWKWSSYKSRTGVPLYKRQHAKSSKCYDAVDLSWQFANGPIPFNHFLRNKNTNHHPSLGCGCVNPDHWTLLEYNLTNCPN